jgi:hypothetical protein
VIVNGGSYRAVQWWANHLQSQDNDRVRIVESYGLRSEEILDMLREMEAPAQGTRCENFFYQMNLNPAPGEKLSEKDWHKVREIAEKHHGFEGQPYFVVEHVKHGRGHQHIVWSRIDLENMRAISDSNDARRNHAIAREIEWKLGLQQTVGPYDREPGSPRPKRAPERWEMYRGMKTGLDPRDIKAEVTELFQQSANGRELQAALEQHGYVLVKGDRRGFVILDSAGKDHSLARRLDGVNTKELNAFMHDVDREALPSVEQGRAQYQERKIANLEADRATVRQEIEWEEALAKTAIEKEKIEGRFVAPEDRGKERPEGRQEKEPVGTRSEERGATPEGVTRSPEVEGGASHTNGRDRGKQEMPENLKGAPAEIWTAYQQSDNAMAFAAALAERGLRVAIVADEDVRSRTGQRDEREELATLISMKNNGVWMMAQGGVGGLTEKQFDSAQRSYDNYRQRGSEQVRKTGKAPLEFDEYVTFIQDKNGDRLAELRQRFPDVEHQPENKARHAAIYAEPGTFAVVNERGYLYHLNERTTGEKPADIQKWMATLDAKQFQSVTATRLAIEEQAGHAKTGRGKDPWPVNPPQPEKKSYMLFGTAAAEASRDDRTEDLRGAAAKVWEAWRQIDPEKHAKAFDALYDKGVAFSVAPDPAAFAVVLDDKGISFARVTKDEADRSHREAEFAKAVGNYAPRFREGEIVMITEPRIEYHRDGEMTEPRRIHGLDQSLADKFVSALGTRNQLQGIDATLQVSNQRAEQRRDDKAAERLEWATDLIDHARPRGKAEGAPAIVGKAPARAIGGAFAIGEQLTGLVFSLLGASKSPQQQERDNREAERTTDKSNAEAEQKIDFAKYTAARQQQDAQEQERQHRQQDRGPGDRER